MQHQLVEEIPCECNVMSVTVLAAGSAVRTCGTAARVGGLRYLRRQMVVQSVGDDEHGDAIDAADERHG